MGGAVSSLTGRSNLPAGAIANSTFFDTIDLSAQVTLSNSARTATKSAVTANAFAFGKHGKESGKWRFQATIVTMAGGAGEIGIGIANPAFMNWGSYLGADAHASSYASVGSVITSGSGTSVATYTQGDVIDIYADLDNNLFWAAKNGAAVTGVVGVSGGLSIAGMQKAAYPAVNMNKASSVVTFNFGSTAFTYASLNAAFLPWSEVQAYSRIYHRRIGIYIRSTGFFAHALAEFKPRDTSGGSSTATGGTAIARATVGGSSPANMVDGNSTTWWGDTTGSGAPGGWCGYDFGADGARSTQYLALQSRDGGGGNQNQAPTDFVIVYGGSSSWYKNSYQTTGAWGANTPGDLREFTLAT